MEDDYLFNYDPISFIRNLQPHSIDDEPRQEARDMVFPTPATAPAPSDTSSYTPPTYLSSSLGLQSLPKLLEALPVSDAVLSPELSNRC